MTHITVLKQEAVDGLNLKPNSVVVDATYGVGGHSAQILNLLGEEGFLLSVDVDNEAFVQNPITNSQQKAVVDNFANIAEILTANNLKTVDAILADLGWRTDQFEEGGKGLSFSSEEPLVMTFDEAENHTFTAADIVNSWEEENLADIIYHYGEERFSRRIAKRIVERRKEKSFETAKELADFIAEVLPKGRSRIHPATKTFQALRITVNDELAALQKLLNDGFCALSQGGRLVVISFHSLEDRIVKHTFRTLAKEQEAKLITKKPITPSDEELAENPRARSAKLRILEK